MDSNAQSNLLLTPHPATVIVPSTVATKNQSNNDPLQPKLSLKHQKKVSIPRKVIPLVVNLGVTFPVVWFWIRFRNEASGMIAVAR
jgi:hypothetical protein